MTSRCARYTILGFIVGSLMVAWYASGTGLEYLQYSMLSLVPFFAFSLLHPELLMIRKPSELDAILRQLGLGAQIILWISIGLVILALFFQFK